MQTGQARNGMQTFNYECLATLYSRSRSRSRPRCRLGIMRNELAGNRPSPIKMPGMSGEEFIARAQQERPDVPVIVVTAFGSIRSAIECIQAGATDYL